MGNSMSNIEHASSGVSNGIILSISLNQALTTTVEVPHQSIPPARSRYQPRAKPIEHHPAALAVVGRYNFRTRTQVAAKSSPFLIIFVSCEHSHADAEPVA